MLPTVNAVINRLSHTYRLKLIAGKGGVETNLVNWVSIVEDCDIEKMKNPNEIVLTAGIKNSNANNLCAFAKKLYLANSCAFIINTGKYIKEVPKNLIDYCNKVNFPLYTVPWDVLMIDIVKDICHIIVYEETDYSNVSETIQNIIFNTGNFENNLSSLERYGYTTNSIFCPIVFKIDVLEKNDSDLISRSLQNYCEKITKSLSNYISFIYKNMVVIVLIDYKKDVIEKLIKTFWENLSLKFLNNNIYICIGHQNDTIYNLSANFKRTLLCINIAIKKEIYVLYYDSLGIYQILSEVSDIQLLKDYYEKTIGCLLRYDAENLTDLTNCIKSYIYFNGNVHEVSNKFYIHRNTVNNQLKKIKEITNVDPLTIEGKVQFSIAMKIYDLYEEYFKIP